MEENKQQESEQQRQEAEQLKNQILSQVLDQEARARLNTIAITKPSKAMAIENLLIQMARSNRLPSKLTSDDLVNLLQQLETTTTKSKVNFSRRKVDSDSDDYDL